MSYLGGYQQTNINLDEVSADSDIQTARIVVGNALEGDTIDEVDFLDSGNGAGVAAAIAASVAAATPTDIYVKSGVYDFNLAGAPALPLPTTLAGTDFRGAGGQAAASVIPGTPGSTTFVLTPTSRALLVGGSASRLSDFAVQVPAAAPGAAGTSVITVATRGYADNITVSFEGAAGINADESLTEVFAVGFVTNASNCRVDNAISYGTPGGTLAAFRFNSSFTTLTDCLVFGLDVGYSVDPGSSQTLIAGCRAFMGAFAGAIGFVLAGIDSRVIGCAVQNTAAGTTSVNLGGTNNSLIGCIFNGGNSGSEGISVTGSRCSVSDCDIVLCLDGISLEAAADLTLLSGNQFRSNTVDIDDANGATNTQRVVATIISDTVLTADDTALVGEILRYDGTDAGPNTFSAPASAARGDTFGIKNMVTGVQVAVTVSGNGVDIESPTTGAFAAAQVVPATPGLSLSYVFDGTQWILIAQSP